MQEPEQHTDKKRNDLGGSIFALVAVVIILVAGSPCICYFGSGLFSGFSQFQTGRYKNPVRGQKNEKYVRPDKFRRSYDKPDRTRR